MTSQQIVRWSLFLLVGLPFQVLVYFAYPVVFAIWRIFFFKKVKPQYAFIDAIDLPSGLAALNPDGVLLKNPDDHGLFAQYGRLWDLASKDYKYAIRGLYQMLDNNFHFLRANDGNATKSYHVSGDVAVAWAFASVEVLGKSSLAAHQVARTYLKNLGTISGEGLAKDWVSARCNNFGLNYCPDGAYGLGQPMTGPQFYTSSSIFALAYHCSLKNKVIFWTHWVLLGGWFWGFWPVMFSKKKKLGYVRDITMKALWVHLRVFGPKWWVVLPMKYIAYTIAEYKNPLFYAMLGKLDQAVYLPAFPEVLNPFFSQKINCENRLEPEANIYIYPAILHINEEAKRYNIK